MVPLVKLSLDRNILNEFAISKLEAFLAFLFGFGLCAGNYVVLLAAEDQPLIVNIYFIVTCVVYSFLSIMIICEKTQRLRLPEDADSNLVDTEAESHPHEHEEEEVDNNIKAGVDFNMF